MLSVLTRLVVLLYISLTILSCYFPHILNNRYLGDTVIYELGDKPLFKTSVPMFYINLDSSKNRRRYMEKAFKNTGKLIRVRAVDGRSDLLENYITSESGNLNQSLASWDCKRNEAAVTASHIFAAKKAFDFGAAAAVIMEDDASPMSAPLWPMSLDEVVQNANKEIPGWQLIWLQYGGGNLIFSKLIASWKNNPEKLFSSKKFYSHGAVAYLISRDGMRFLIDKFIDKEGRVVLDRGGYKCASDVLLRKHIPNIYHKTPPMFISRIHEDSTGVRIESGGHVNDHYMYHIQDTVFAYSWMLQDYEIKTYWENAKEALSKFPINLWTVGGESAGEWVKRSVSQLWIYLSPP